jgi:hypothetical protein
MQILMRIAPPPRHVLAAALGLALTATAWAKLPAPSDEAKAKAAEAAAKAAWTNKVADFQLCKSMDHVAQRHSEQARKAGKTVQPTPTPPCADPGAFTYTPATTAAAAPAPAAKPAAAPAAASAPAAAPAAAAASKP